MKKTRYKLNFKKIFRNILIIIFLIISINYIKNMNLYNKKVFSNYPEFIEYAKSNNLTITEDNYKNFISKTN